jgi:hypothetical protein
VFCFGPWCVYFVAASLRELVKRWVVNGAWEEERSPPLTVSWSFFLEVCTDHYWCCCTTENQHAIANVNFFSIWESK